MCVVSMIGDFYGDKWGRPKPSGPWDQIPVNPFPTVFPTQDMSKDIEQLRKEVQEMKELLKRAIAYDKANGEPACENDEKIKFLKRVAEAVGLSLDDLFKEKE